VELTSDLLVTAGAGLAIVFGAVWRYVTVRGQGSGSAAAPLPNSHQAERMTIALEKIAAAMETVADERQTDMQKTLHMIAEHVAAKKSG